MNRSRSPIHFSALAAVCYVACSDPGGSSSRQAEQVSTLACGSAAEHQTATVSCPSGQTISSISFASYGTPAGTCGSYATGSCNATTSLSLVQGACVGKASCSVFADNSVFGDPCAGTRKSLDIEAQCSGSSGSATCGTANENQSTTVSCPPGQVINSIVFASYGTPSGSCGSFATSSCNAATSTSVVSSQCMGLSSCTIAANNTTFGDPCKGTGKHLDVQVACGSGTASDASNLVWTNRYDNARTGTQLDHTFTTTNVSRSNGFGLKFTRAVDGIVQAQPLVVSGLSVQGATHNVVFVATEHNSVYAFDADQPAASSPLWVTSLGPAAPANSSIFGCSDLFPEVGVTSTPVIDVAGSRILVVAKTLEGGTYHHRLHSLDLSTGAERAGSPVDIGPSGFNHLRQLNRAGLLLTGGVVYIAFGSHCDGSNYHGWILGYDTNSLALRGTYNNTPNGTQGGIWQAGMGLSADSGGIYFAAGNGTFDASGNGTELGQSVARITPNGSGFNVADLWTPTAAAADNGSDADLSTGVVIAPGTQFVFVGGKDKTLHVLNRTALGGFHSDFDRQFQSIGLSGHMHGGPVFWNGSKGPTLFAWPESGHLTQFTVGSQGLTQTAQSSVIAGGHPGGMVTASSNGSAAGTGIVWATLAPTGDAWHSLAPGALYAFDAQDVGTLLWSSEANSTRDALGLFAKFNPPVVANGHVYVGTASKTLAVYGLLP